MGDIEIEVPPIGVKVLKSLDGFEDIEVLRVASYCEAIKVATSGREILVTPESIEVCKWSPVILGLKRPESKFDKGIGPRMEEPLVGYYIAPITNFRKGSKPDVVIIRSRPEQLRAMTGALGEAALVTKYRGEIGKTALGAGENEWNIKLRLSRGLLRLLATLRRSKSWDRFTRFAFRSQRVSSALERIIKNTMGDMSVCRNSTVIPYLENAANVSFFCTGGIAWGGNEPSHLTSGIPCELFDKIYERLEFPGSTRE
jgi:uncharacterized protein (DUF169 family)